MTKFNESFRVPVRISNQGDKNYHLYFKVESKHRDGPNVPERLKQAIFNNEKATVCVGGFWWPAGGRRLREKGSRELRFIVPPHMYHTVPGPIATGHNRDTMEIEDWAVGSDADRALSQVAWQAAKQREEEDQPDLELDPQPVDEPEREKPDLLTRLLRAVGFKG